jgi:hypothetical protein
VHSELNVFDTGSQNVLAHAGPFVTGPCDKWRVEAKGNKITVLQNNAVIVQFWDTVYNYTGTDVGLNIVDNSSHLDSSLAYFTAGDIEIPVTLTTAQMNLVKQMLTSRLQDLTGNPFSKDELVLVQSIASQF